MQRKAVGRLGSLAFVLAAVASLLGGCGSSNSPPRVSAPDIIPPASTLPPLRPALLSHADLPGMPPNPIGDVYAYDRPNALNAISIQARPLVYVPNSASSTVDVIDQKTLRIVAHFHVGALPQHVVPAWDLRALFVTNDAGNSLTPIDPRTGHPGHPVKVADPYNLYFTPNGRYGIVVAEALHRLDFRDPHSWHLHHALSVPCTGVDHIDFSANGRILLASCEFSSELVIVDVARQKVLGKIRVPGGAMPQDVKLSPDGRIFYVADQVRGGVYEVSAHTLHLIGFIHTGAGAHGLYVSRSSRTLFVTNRRDSSVSLIDLHRRRVVRTWKIPNSSPDMGGLSADGNTLWLSGRYNAEVYAIDTRTGHLRARISVGEGPHGLSVWPQPGRYSLGHTGILR